MTIEMDWTREPPLETLLNEPIVQLLMRRDQVNADAVRRMRPIHESAETRAGDLSHSS